MKVCYSTISVLFSKATIDDATWNNDSQFCFHHRTKSHKTDNGPAVSLLTKTLLQSYILLIFNSAAFLFKRIRVEVFKGLFFNLKYGKMDIKSWYEFLLGINARVNLLLQAQMCSCEICFAGALTPSRNSSWTNCCCNCEPGEIWITFCSSIGR